MALAMQSHVTQILRWNTLQLQFHCHSWAPWCDDCYSLKPSGRILHCESSAMRVRISVLSSVSPELSQCERVYSHCSRGAMLSSVPCYLCLAWRSASTARGRSSSLWHGGASHFVHGGAAGFGPSLWDWQYMARWALHFVSGLGFAFL